MCRLSSQHCVPCQGGVPPLNPEQIKPLIEQLAKWEVIDNHHLTRTYEFPGFAEALAFVNRVGGLAEQEGHHPDLHLSWGKVGVEIWTHKVDGLTESDFILAAKIDTL